MKNVISVKRINSVNMKNYFLIFKKLYFVLRYKKILKEMGLPDHLTCLLRNLYAGQEETVRTGHGTTDWDHGPITSWQIEGETVTDFIFLGSKITADGDCSHEIKRCLLLGRKVMTKLDSIFKSRDITLPTKVHLVTAMVFQ